MRVVIDLATIMAGIGYVLIISSAFPQLYRNFKERYVGNQMFIFYGQLLLGQVLLVPSVFLSSRIDLMWGTIANAIDISLLVLSVLLFRKNRAPRTKS